ncbi:trans-L-3-hydroxyproline dehydratase-like [Diadema antillarum]|uniref:trans-L-3-hydroxyproline dehydratase-like n=1 Tax=Diadema antillarum TaxID=105358 RepID=UPI003A89ACE3
MAESTINTSPYKIDTIEMHAGGDSLRLILSGFPKNSGNTMMEKWRHVRDQFDDLRRALMLAPRGNGSYGLLIVEPDHNEADLAVILMCNQGFGAMCGSGNMALARYAVDFGIVKAVAPETQVNIQWVSGLVKTFVEYDGQTKRSGKARFHSVPAFALKTVFILVMPSDIEVDVTGYGAVTVDIGYGGAYYAYVSADQLGLDVCKSSMPDIQSAAVAVAKAVGSAVNLTHPTDPDLATLYGTIITDGKNEWSLEPSVNICVSAAGQVARGPCASGVTGRIAVQVDKGLIDLNQVRRFQSGVSSLEFTGKAVERTKVGNYDAVVVEVAGKGHFIGRSTFFAEEEDALCNGFLLE